MKKDHAKIECEELSRRYTAGEMTEREAKSFRKHLAACASCKQLVSEWDELFAVLSAPAIAPQLSEPSPQFDAAIMAFVRNMIRSRAEVAARARAEAAVFADAAAAQAAARAEKAARAGVPAYADAAAQASQVARARGALISASLRRKLIWAASLSSVAVLVVLGLVIRGFTITLPSGERQYVSAVVWIVDVLGRGLDWFFTSLMRTIKVGEIFIQLARIFDPILNVLRLAAERIDPQVILIEVLLFLLGFMILKAFVAPAQKERCSNVGIRL